MHSVLSNQDRKKRASVRLLLSVHLDAARFAPRKYLIAMWWRLWGKRLRSKGQLAPLLARSRQAYGLWLLNESNITEAPPREAPQIVALINGAGEDAVRTARSLALEGIHALRVGSPCIPTVAKAAQKIDWSQNPWLMTLAPGDTIAKGAANTYRAVAAATNKKLIYADDDLIDHHDRRFSPHFKPEWNDELSRHFDMVTGACIFKAMPEDLLRAGDCGWSEELTFSAAAKGQPIHIPQVLHHRRSRPRPRIPAQPDMHNAQHPSVTLIIPTRNRVDLLRTCCEGLERTDYPDLDVIIIDNGSDDRETLDYLERLRSPKYRVLRHPGPFNFSTLNNRAAKEAKGHLLCLLNNDIEVIEPGWLKKLSLQAQRPEVGAVGAQLLYPDGRIQHAGVVLGVGGGAAHAHRLLRPTAEGYFFRHALPQFVSAVTAACLVVRRDRFMAVGGFDEANFAVAFNDVDLCMRLNERGWQSFYEPRATLIHRESVSRGFDRDPVGAARLAREIAALQSRWRTHEQVDPYHHPQLNRYSEHFVVQL